MKKTQTEVSTVADSIHGEFVSLGVADTDRLALRVPYGSKHRKNLSEMDNSGWGPSQRIRTVERGQEKGDVEAVRTLRRTDRQQRPGEILIANLSK